MCLDEAARRQSALSVNKMSNPDLLPNNKTVVRSGTAGPATRALSSSGLATTKTVQRT